MARAPQMMPRDDGSAAIPVMGNRDATTNWEGPISAGSTVTFSGLTGGNVYEIRRTPGSAASGDYAVYTVDGTTPAENTDGAGYAWGLFSNPAIPLHVLPHQTQIKVKVVTGTNYLFCLRRLE